MLSGTSLHIGTGKAAAVSHTKKWFSATEVFIMGLFSGTSWLKAAAADLHLPLGP
jgi:hypothetical protein